MTIHYSASKNAFFDDQVFGPRQIDVLDEKARDRALKQISDSEAELHEKLEAADDKKDQERLRGALDELSTDRIDVISNPPLMTIDNPDCKLPEDAVPISAEKHAELMAAQAVGKAIRPGKDGQPVVAERERSADEVLAAARVSRDRQLAATDWTQLPDALTEAKRKAWAAHRKHLRDIPARIEALIAKGNSPADAAELVQRNVAGTSPDQKGA